MKDYLVYVKSHCEAPDYEAVFSEDELTDKKCLVPYAEDYDKETGQAIGGKCGGKLVKTKDGYKCQDCNAHYLEQK
jgi:hypothetical protein